jgi:ADP-ribose pyrophosphatase YjhB (NUDIX family)
VAPPAVEVAVGAIVRRGDALLLVRRGRGPGAGRWSVPGGRVQPGETLRAAVEREVLEETGVRVRAEAFAGWVERIGDDPFPHHYVILDFFASEADATAEAVAGDDAAALAWVPIAGVRDVELVDGLADFLTQVGVIAAQQE